MKRLVPIFALIAVFMAGTARAQKKVPIPKAYRALAARLDTIYHEDQDGRVVLMDIFKAEGKSARFDSLAALLAVKDSLNLLAVRSILDRYGWLGPAEVGGQGASTLFLVIQHADPATMERYVPLFRAAVKAGKGKAAELALMEDRILVDKGQPQIYGSQVKSDPATGKFSFFPIGDERNVNARRASVGLGTIEKYAKEFGFEYKPAGH
ncbi:MAG: hypothetical protein EOO16_14160 [Chitinophagaceae bacterium]|nr:MAG: hypothetical protein EOO16_14160 [Chitinophagaceae bacterium]